MNKKLKYPGGSQRISCGTKHEKYSQSYYLSSIRCKSNFAVFPIKYLLVVQMRDSNFNSTSAFPATNDGGSVALLRFVLALCEVDNNFCVYTVLQFVHNFQMTIMPSSCSSSRCLTKGSRMLTMISVPLMIVYDSLYVTSSLSSL